MSSCPSHNTFLQPAQIPLHSFVCSLSLPWAEFLFTALSPSQMKARYLGVFIDPLTFVPICLPLPELQKETFRDGRLWSLLRGNPF